MNIPVFLSFPKPFTEEQQRLIDGIFAHLSDHGIEPRTLGGSDYDNEVPLRAIRRMLLESNGVLSVGLRRYRIERGETKPGTADRAGLDDKWFTSPWPHIETAMGYQMGLPIMVLRESGVHADGVFERGTIESFVHEVDCADSQTFLTSRQWRQPFSSWERDVRTVAKSRGTPPKLY